jgi:hypothetical protein
MATGRPYDIPRATTEADNMALKALLEPKKMQPKITSKRTVRMSAFNGTCNFGWTLAKTLENGRPPSLHSKSPLAGVHETFIHFCGTHTERKPIPF